MSGAEPVSEVRDHVRAWIDAINRHDLDAVTAGRADAVVFYDVPEPAELRGIEAYRASWQDFLGWVTRFELDDLEVVADRDVAFCHGIVRCAGKTEPTPFEVRLTLGLRKLDGQWRVTHEHHSVPAPSAS